MKETIQRLLVANRGDPVFRAIRTARERNLTIIAVHTPDDRETDWVASADVAIEIPSYLDGDAILAAARQSHADAIWPAWGFLSENADFAAMVEASGIKWVGPSSSVIRILGDKAQSTEVAKKAHVPTIPEDVASGTDLELARATIHASAKTIGFPLLIKPALGGGGQGQEIVRHTASLDSAIESAFRVNAAQFKSGPLLIQKFFESARHIEAQMLADQHGDVVVFHERECSIQRRNQKVIEESPSTALSPDLRQHMIRVATSLAQTCGYSSAGTMEMLLSDNQLYFLEVNTRLQVEHPVTEESSLVTISGKQRKPDILSLMLDIAEGKSLPFKQGDITISGHAIEARIYAENPARDFQPSSGTITRLLYPSGIGVRVDGAMRGPTAEVSSKYDPMIAKVIALGEHRNEAIHRLHAALGDLLITGITTNTTFCQHILSHPHFQSGDFSTRFIGDHLGELLQTPDLDATYIIAAAIHLYRHHRQALINELTSGLFHDAGALLREIPPHHGYITFELNGYDYPITISECTHSRYLVQHGEMQAECDVIRDDGHAIVIRVPSGEIYRLAIDHKGNNLFILSSTGHRDVTWRWSNETGVAKNPYAAPSAGRIVSIPVKIGDVVETDGVLFVTEAMKMESRIRAVEAVRVTAILASAGDAIDAGEEVVQVESLSAETTLESTEATTPDLVWPHTLSPFGEWVLNPLKMAEQSPHFTSTDDHDRVPLIHAFFMGYDIPIDSIKASLLTPTPTDSLITWLESLMHLFHQNRTLFSEDHLHSVIHFLGTLSEKNRSIPTETEALLLKALSFFSITSTKDSSELREAMLRLFQAYRHGREVQMELMVEILSSLTAISSETTRRLSGTIIRLIESPTFRRSADFVQQLTSILRHLDKNRYYDWLGLSVAPEYRPLYDSYVNHPMETLTASDRKAIHAACEAPFIADADLFGALTHESEQLLTRWFPSFVGQQLPIPSDAAAHGITMIRLHDTTNATSDRLLAVCVMKEADVSSDGSAIVAFPKLEQALIHAYRLMRIYNVLIRTEPNHVMVFTPANWHIDWSPAGTQRGLSLESIGKLSNRIAGFARGIRITATEVIVSMTHSGMSGRSIIDVRHSGDIGALSRPPFPVLDRAPEVAGDTLSAANDRQIRMGKLLNTDRARLLFDDGIFDECFFPEVDQQTDANGDPITVGLNVFRGTIKGRPAMAYAGDFRFRGGALGEREGKKLASSVVLAYTLGIPLIGIHDGAGADIKGSVASLGWAGSYFGAIAQTGGFSHHASFKAWFDQHIHRPYFESVLTHFGAPSPLSLDSREPLLHLHLHLGAAVGMLVYGPAISSFSIIVDHPQVYRLLTGAATVEKVTGEKSTNYDLGGAKAHGHKSGDIDLICRSEEEAIATTRRIIDMVAAGSTPFSPTIQRDTTRLSPTISESAAIIVGRDMIETNVDAHSFIETRSELGRAGSLLTGLATLGHHPVMIAATATDYGLHHPRAFKKMNLAAATAQDMRLPLIVAFGASWDRLHPVVRTEAIYQQQEMRRMLQQLETPRIGIAIGPRALERSICQYMDLIVYIRRGTETDYENERAHLLSHIVVDSFSEAMDAITAILQTLHPSSGRHIDPSTDISSILPASLNAPYEMRNMIKAVVDPDSFIEFARHDHLPLIVGIAHMNGACVGIIADQPNVIAGAQTGVSISKFTRFHRVCERFRLPIIELNDSPAFTPGSEQEHGGIQGEGGRSIREEVLSTIPKIAVTLRQNYGGRYIHANLVTLGPPRSGLVLEGARIGVMGSEGAVGVLFGKKLAAISDTAERDRAKADWIKRYEATNLNPQQAVNLGYADRIVPHHDLRKAIIETLSSINRK